MATNRRKHKKKKASVFTPATAPHLSGIPLALCGVALLVAAIALAVNITTLNLGKFTFAYDAFSVYRPFLDLTRFDFPLDGWRIPVAPFYFPDYLLFFLIAALTPTVWALPIYAIGITLISVVGWTLLCRDLGGSRKMQMAVWACHALPILLMAYDSGLFLMTIMPLMHAGLWIFIPWLLWATYNPQRHWLLFILTAALAASDLLVITWYVIPALFALTIATYYKRFTIPQLARVTAFLITAVLTGKGIANLLPFATSPNASRFTTPDTSQLLDNVIGMGKNLWWLVAEYPFLSIVWFAFVVAIAYIVITNFRRPNFSSPHLFLIIFIPAAMVCPVAAQTIIGIEFNQPYQGADGIGDPHFDTQVRFRYFYPFVYLPLFVGWAFLPFYFHRWHATTLRISDRTFAASLLAGFALAAALPLAKAFDTDHIISPFNTAFDNCIKQAAKRLGWTGAIGTYRFWNRAVIDPDNPISQSLNVEALPRSEQFADTPFYINWEFTNRHWYTGDFQAVAIDRYNDKRFVAPPRTKADACETQSCRNLFASRYIDEATAQAVWGVPAEVVECEGVAIYHYDPPITYDFSNRTTAHDYPIFLRKK